MTRLSIHSVGAGLRRGLRWLFEQRYRFPLTPLGLALVFVAWWVYVHFGDEQVDFVLHAGALVALLLLGLSVAAVLIVSGILWLRLRGQRGLDHLELEAGTRAATGYSFPRFRAWPLVQVRLGWAEPAGVEASMEQSGGRVQEVVQPSRRGESTAVRRRFIVADIFGLARFGVTRRAEQRVRILPGRARVSGQVISSFVGGDGLSHPTGPIEGERSDMRRYAPGDPLRFVLWKAFARTRQLLVRAPERAIAPSPSVRAYYIAGKDDEPTAAAARFFLEQGLLGADFTFGADGSPELVTEAGQAIELIVRSAAVAPADGAFGLGHFLDQAERARQRALILFFPPSVGRWLERVAQHAARLRGATVICAIDGGLARVQRSPLSRLLFSAPAESHGKRETSLPDVVARLGSLGLAVRVLHRPSGELIATQTIMQAAAPQRTAR